MQLFTHRLHDLSVHPEEVLTNVLRPFEEFPTVLTSCQHLKHFGTLVDASNTPTGHLLVKLAPQASLFQGMILALELLLCHSNGFLTTYLIKAYSNFWIGMTQYCRSNQRCGAQELLQFHKSIGFY